MPKLYNQINVLHNKLQRQRGAALMLMLVILILGASAMLLNSLNSTTTRFARDRVTADALAQAKEALIGFAVTYGDTYIGNVHGYLPCPDKDGLPYEGGMESPCGSKNVSQIGRLPWRSLNLPPLRDGTGECLWYAVTGTYKYNPKTDLMNWDTNGQLQGYSTDGTLFTQSDNQVVAVIFAPGSSLTGQDRSSSGTPVCGGNYTATNYLDNDTLHSFNNADISTAKYILPHEHRDINGNIILTVNDQMLFITKSDIFNAIKKRNNLGAFVSSLLNTAAACALPPVTVNYDNSPPNETAGVTIGSLKTGRIPKTCLTVPYNNWQDNLLYARCSTGTCLTVNGSPCSGIVIFSGERNSPQARITNAQKNIWDNYLEDAPNSNLSSFNTGGTTFSGASSYSATTPSTDILKCIP